MLSIAVKESQKDQLGGPAMGMIAHIQINTERTVWRIQDTDGSIAEGPIEESLRGLPELELVFLALFDYFGQQQDKRSAIDSIHMLIHASMQGDRPEVNIVGTVRGELEPFESE